MEVLVFVILLFISFLSRLIIFEYNCIIKRPLVNFGSSRLILEVLLYSYSTLCLPIFIFAVLSCCNNHLFRVLSGFSHSILFIVLDHEVFHHLVNWMQLYSQNPSIIFVILSTVSHSDHLALFAHYFNAFCTHFH